jgi:sulfoxide reductase catalytic subunit YedY
VAVGAVGSVLGSRGRGAWADETDPSAGLYPAKHNDAYKIEGVLTPEDKATHYNNYYEFGDSKNIADAAQALPIRPWSVTIDGMVEKPQTIAIDDLLKAMPLEERIYRHRCVEAWSMAVPWSGFPLKALVDFAKPTSGAKYLRFESFSKPDVAPGQNEDVYPWPYIEGVTLAEATNELAFISTGLYGKPIAKQNGAPIRLTLPWKYGFKSAKGIVKITFTDQRPKTFWEAIQSSEYGFWANVNPEVAHPRWSQASERDLGTGDQRDTQLFNGYAAQVASLYTGLENETLYR